jgi:hypothetical protein
MGVRSDIVRLTSGLLLGPLEGDEHLGSPPADTYLTGVLWPRGAEIDVLEDDQTEGAAQDLDSETEAGIPGYRAIRPCSFGLTFAVGADEDLQVSLGQTARYRQVTTQREADAPGTRATFTWQRAELRYRLQLESGPTRTWRTHDFTDAAGETITDLDVELHIRRRLLAEQQVYTITLINSAVESDDRLRDELCLFQTELIVTSVGREGAGGIRPRPVLPPMAGDEDAETAALLYRTAVEFAVGHGTSVSWEAGTQTAVPEVRTTWLPIASVSGVSRRGHPDLRNFNASYPQALDAAWLAREGSRDEIVEALQSFAKSYWDWIETALMPHISDFQGLLRGAADRNYRRCRLAADRIDRGIRTLAENTDAWTAFSLANAAMDRQAQFDSKGSRKAPLRWYPFQLAYILLVLPGLVDPEPEENARDVVDLLWFPTGGGKTEAYLCLTAFQIFLRRLADEERPSRGGVDVLMRYTLRLLTVQQFQRAAALICACDGLRRERTDLGQAEISLGLYVGGDATPNRVEEARSALAEEHAGNAPRSTPRQLLVCPVCATELRASCYSFRVDSSGIDICCPNSTCPTFGSSLPVLTVDDFIYDAPPSLLIGTVDKFAQLPRRKDIRSLFGRPGGTPPGLIIQDELHLISGPLGSMTGLYETVIDLLCTRAGIRPKVIGSTATIGQAAKQVRALFDRDVLQFPPPGFDASDSYFAVEEQARPDRLYVGVSSAGRSPKFALQAVAAALLQVPKKLLSLGEDEQSVDPYWTCVLYFNSLRELGGAYVLLQDDVPRQMGFLATRLDDERRELEDEPIELSSRVPSRDLPVKLAALAVEKGDEDPFGSPPKDTVLASNMISVGVDVSRLGLMVINGQPKSTAEYIQASSRVGRGLPGLVVTLYNFGRPRDVSHFEHFPGYHAALYRNVEATSVTPWAPRARDKALHAVVAAAVRHLVDGMEDDSAALNFDPADPMVEEIIQLISQRAASSSEGVEGAETAEDLRSIVDEWAHRGHDARGANRKLVYWERKAPFGATSPHLMTSAEEGGRATGHAWSTPNSMREVEPSTAFALKRIGGG